MPKTLRVTFSGICTRAPGYPLDGEQEPDKVYVLMPAARSSRPARDAVNAVNRHHAFIYVPAGNINGHPEPAVSVDDESLGLCHIYLVDGARLTFDPKPLRGIEHYITRRPMDDRPGSPDKAPESDVRWLADMRDIVPGAATLKVTADPRRNDIAEQVAMVVELSGGVVKAHFPCKTVQPQSFRPVPEISAPPAGTQNPPPRTPVDRLTQPRVIACEFVVEMEYADATSAVTLNVGPLGGARELAESDRAAADAVPGFDAKKLVIRWGRSREVNIRIGNDTFDEILALQSVKRCNVRPAPVERDNDFDLHYNLLDIPSNSPRPLPFNGAHQTQHNGCAGASANLNQGGTS